MVTATPLGAVGQVPIQQPTYNTQPQMDFGYVEDIINDIPNEVPPVMEQTAQNMAKDDIKVNAAKKKLEEFKEYISGERFKNDIHNTAAKYRVPERELATNFIGKVLGTIGDACGIVIGTVRNGVHTLVSVLAAILNGAADVICNVASALTRVLTLNKTCVA